MTATPSEGGHKRNVRFRGSLVNQASSYSNFSSVTYCAYDRRRNGTRIFLWRMLPGGSSAWVGRELNDRADLVDVC